MKQSIKKTKAARRLPFSIRINLRQLEAVLREMKLGDRRTLDDWIEEGLRLALIQSLMRPALSEQAREVCKPCKGRAAVALRADEELLTREERLANLFAGERLTGEVSNA